jgi:transketolase
MITVDTINEARKLLLAMHHGSGVGHLGGNLSCLDAMMVLHHEYLGAEDRFILSKGHSAGALYVVLATRGLISRDELATFHKDGTRLPGHPPAKGLVGVEFATGSLGHGLSLAAGTALARRLQGAVGHVYCLTSDGEWQEGSTWEALIFLCHNKLANLTVLVDHNRLQGFGTTGEVASMDPLHERLAGFDLDLQFLNGHDISAIRAALGRTAARPRVLVLDTIKGRGVPGMEHQMASHYLPIDPQTYAAALREVDAQ